MEQYVGLDVSLKETSLCVVDQTGTTLWQGKCASTPESIAAVLARRAPGATRIGLESGLLSTWHWHALKALGLPVVCLDARHVKAALSLRLNKTDANDAEGLAQIVRTGWYRQVQVKSLHLIRTLLAARAGLVAMHRDVANQIRGALKTFGLVLGKVAAGAFEARVRQLIAGNPLLVEVIEALLKVWRTTGEQLVTLHRRVLRLAQTDETCRRLMTVPGVGAVTAAAFMATVDDPERFRRSSSVGAYFGLTPRRCQSGDIDYTGRISKRGDGLMRSYLFEAANVLLTRVSTWSTLKAWGMRLAKRSGATKAKVALAPSWRSSCIACGATARASGGRRRRSADDGLNNEIRRRRTVSLPGRPRGLCWSVPNLGRLRLQHWGGRSAQRHHGVDDVPTPERTVDPTAISEGPGSLRSRPQLENSAVSVLVLLRPLNRCCRG